MGTTPFMQLYVADYLADTRHLTTEQHGAYLLLLMTMWKAGGSLPNDPKKLSRIAGVSARRWHIIAEDVMDFFDVRDDVVTQKRLSEEYQKAVSKSEKRSASGKLGGIAKALKTNKPPLANAKATPKHSSESESYSKDIGKPISCSFDAFWSLWPNKNAKKDAEKTWRQMSPQNRQAAHDAVKAGWFVKWRSAQPKANPILPASFLRGERWNDQFSVQSSPGDQSGAFGFIREAG